MANLREFTDAQVPSLLQDHEREIINTRTQYIDLNRTHMNTDLHAQTRNMGAYEYYLFRRNQAYLVPDPTFHTLGSWIITAPRNVPEEGLPAFFEAYYKFNGERYGWENIVACCVHYDESRPHCHLTVMPIVYDEKHKSEKFAPKQKFSKEDLTHYHIDLLNYMTAKLGYAPEVANQRGGAWKEENLKNTAGPNQNANIRNEYEQINKAVQALTAQKEALEKEIQDLRLQRTELIGATQALNNEYLAKKAFIDQIRSAGS